MDTVIETNYCTGQLDEDSAGIDSRASTTILRYNKVVGCKGAGVRLGGHKVGHDQYGIACQVGGEICGLFFFNWENSCDVFFSCVSAFLGLSCPGERAVVVGGAGGWCSWSTQNDPHMSFDVFFHCRSGLIADSIMLLV